MIKDVRVWERERLNACATRWDLFVSNKSGVAERCTEQTWWCAGWWHLGRREERMDLYMVCSVIDIGVDSKNGEWEWPDWL